VLDVAPANPGAKPNAAVADGNVAEPRNPAQIDQHAWRRQPEGENRNQALPASDYGCLGIRQEQVDRFPECGWGLVLEGSWFHPLASQSELSAQQDRAQRAVLGHGLARDPYRCSQKLPVAGDDLAVEQYELAGRMSSDSFGGAADGDSEEGGRAAGRDAVITDAQCPRACGAHQVEGDLYLVVTAEIAFPADHRGAFQQVAGAV